MGLYTLESTERHGRAWNICVAFPQNIDDMATELPRKPGETVIFVRKMGNSKSTAVHLKHLKVRRSYVLRALKWLKLHHSSYHEIKINEDNLDWMNGKKEAQVSRNVKYVHINGKSSIPHEKTSISTVQCTDPTDDFVMDFATTSHKPEGLDPNQSTHMKDLVDTAVDSDKKHELLTFPPHEDTPVE